MKDEFSSIQETVFSCLLCKLCEVNCPAGVHITENVRALRHYSTATFSGSEEARRLPLIQATRSGPGGQSSACGALCCRSRSRAPSRGQRGSTSLVA